MFQGHLGGEIRFPLGRLTVGNRSNSEDSVDILRLFNHLGFFLWSDWEVHVRLDSFLVATLRLGMASLAFLFFLRIRTIEFNRSDEVGCDWGCSVGLMWVAVGAFSSLILVAIFSGNAFVVPVCFEPEKLFEKKFILVALLSVVGAGIVGAESVPSGDIWIGFYLCRLLVCFLPSDK